MLGTLVLATKASWQSQKKSLPLQLVYIRIIQKDFTESNTHRRAGLRHKYQSSEAEEEQTMRSHPAKNTRASVAAAPSVGLYTPFSQAMGLIPAKLTPNLLILIIDLVNKERISNSHKYEPCLERLECRNISSMKYSYS